MLHRWLRTLRQCRALLKSRRQHLSPWQLRTYLASPMVAESPSSLGDALPPASVATPVLSYNHIQLRPYQQECIETVLRAFVEGKRQVGVSLATGSGKTVIFTELIGRVEPPNLSATRTLILVHRRELVEQAARQCSRRYPDKNVEIEMGSLKASGMADITVASIQSINSGDRIDKFDHRLYKLVLVDEAHHVVSPAYLRVLDHFGIPQAKNDMMSTPYFVGVSATLSRLDGVALGKVIKHIVYHKDYVDMIGEKWLSDVIFTTVSSGADLSKVRARRGGDFATSELSEAVNRDEVNEITVRAWQNRAAGRHSTIVFCVDLAHVDSLTTMFRRFGVDARFVTGDTPKLLRHERLEGFKNREFPVLVNCGVFTEGTDIPNIDCVLLARPTKSKNLLVQMIGRGMRLYEGKKNCHIIDMVASLQTGIVTTPTLFGLDPNETIVNMDPDKLRKLKERKERERERQKMQEEVSADSSIMRQPLNYTGSITFTDYTSVADLIEDTSADRFIRALSPHAWVNVGPDRYVLTNGSLGDYMVLEQNHMERAPSATSPDESQHAPLWKVVLANKLVPSSGKAPFTRPRVLLTARTFDAAVNGADTYASKHFLRFFISLHGPKSSGWRQSQASRAQVDFLNKHREPDRKLKYGQVMKGTAQDMITKLKFGAKGRVGEMLKQRKREEKARAKVEEWEKMVERVKVRVGPLNDKQ